MADGSIFFAWKSMKTGISWVDQLDDFGIFRDFHIFFSDFRSFFDGTRLPFLSFFVASMVIKTCCFPLFSHLVG